MPIDLDRDGDVHLIHLREGENRIDRVFVDRLNGLLDEVESQSESSSALVVTGEHKFFCNGLDVDRLLALTADEKQRFGSDLSALLARLLILPVPTVAALNGHAFAGGAILSLAFDYRLMREDRGWICLAEVDVGVPIGPGMMGLARAKLPATTVRSAVLEGRRFAADEAIAAGFADGKAAESDLVGIAIKRAAELASKERGIFGTLKRTLWRDVAVGLDPSLDG
jgi:enoyl-CoA hydratase/carnithine racemase